MRVPFVLLVVGLLVASLLPPASGTGASVTFRIMTHGDVGAFSIFATCPPSVPSIPAVWCLVARDFLGYDGITGAAIEQDQIAGHLGHSFVCAATSSATPGFESISVGFDTNGDTITDVHYPNTAYRPLDEVGVGGVPNPLYPTVGPQTINPFITDGSLITAVIRGHFWPSVSGTIDGGYAIIFNHIGEDVTVDCAY